MSDPAGLTMPVRVRCELPRHTRTSPEFLQAFDRSAAEALARMDAAGDDIASQPPRHAISIDRMGLMREAVPVQIVDPFDNGALARLSCTVDLATRLAPDRRGIHVSRIGDLLARLALETHDSLTGYAVAVSDALGASQAAEAAFVTVRGVLSYLERVPSARERSSIEHVELVGGVEDSPGDRRLTSGIGFNHLAACPCVQQTLRHSLADKRRALVDQATASGVPPITHSQRCHMRVMVASPAPSLTVADWLDCVDEVLVRCQNTLPRDLELLAVHRAHGRPQFIEDAMRDLLVAVYARLRHGPPESTIAIDATSQESIHDFAIGGRTSRTVAELRAILG